MNEYGREKKGGAMATDVRYLNYILEQLSDLDQITYKKMFGEYALYYNKKVVALLCDHCIYLKPTEAGRKNIQDVEEAQPFPGSKNYFLISDQLENKSWIAKLMVLTYNELPEPKKKKKNVSNKL